MIVDLQGCACFSLYSFSSSIVFVYSLTHSNFLSFFLLFLFCFVDVDVDVCFLSFLFFPS